MNHTRTLMVALLLAGDVLPSPAQADEIESVLIEQGEGTHHINFHRNPIVVTFDASIVEYHSPDPRSKWAIEVDVLPGAKALLFRRLIPSRLEQLDGVVHVSTTRGSNVILTFSGVADEASASSPMIRVVEVEEQDERLEQELAARDEKHRREVAALQAELSRMLRAKDEKALLREVDNTATMYALTSNTCEAPGVVICANRWAALHQRGVLHFTVANNTMADFEFSRVQAFRGLTPGNVASSVRIGSEDPVAPDGVRGLVPPNGQLEVSVVIKDPRRVGQKLRLELSGPDTMTAITFVDLRPQTGEGRITIRVQPTIGGVWLANPVSDKELGAAVLMGLGLRLTYGLHTMWAVDAELAGIRSNDASFEQVSVDGTIGDIHRSTSGARLLFSGVLRFGTKVQPLLRLGFGAQVVDHDVRFVTGQTTTTGPGAGLALDGLIIGGFGVDIHLGKHWIAGAGLSFIQGRGTKSAAFSTAAEGGIHIGYGWGGYVRD